MDIELFIDFIDFTDFSRVSRNWNAESIITMQEKVGRCSFPCDAYSGNDCLGAITTIIKTTVQITTMMQFWQPPKHSIAGYKVVSQRLQQIFGENAAIAVSFMALFWRAAQKGLKKKMQIFPASIFSSIRNQISCIELPSGPPVTFCSCRL